MQPPRVLAVPLASWLVRVVVSAIVFVVALSAASAKPYEDTKSRFRLDMPEDWKWAPQPGDTSGTWFRRTNGLAVGNFSVRVIKLDRSTTLETVKGEAERAIVAEPGYRRLAEEALVVGGRPATRREYTMFVAGSDRTQRRVDDYFLQNGDHAFWLHFESLAEGFDLYRDDVSHFLASFVPIAGGQSTGVMGGVALELLGRWTKVGDGALVLDLRSDQQFTLGPTQGSFTVERETLTLKTEDGEERFRFILKKDELTLAGPHLDVPIKYNRINRKLQGGLAGAWSPRKGVALGALSLSPGGQFKLGNITGNYRVRSDLLVLRDSSGNETIYTFVVDGNVLKLSGGDIASEAKFDRK